ncbi:two-component sensor histidine kinase [Phytohabitans aurantiacus]|uniref:histidine kinase n=1 Tax=Phytohabitans aurantiacus TaxID=3016789 RepID=A0ABQ5QZ19_9ACTN|nr:two-component sensor histidine kinase [Phytohabitans aurantiacus]
MVGVTAGTLVGRLRAAAGSLLRPLDPLPRPSLSNLLFDLGVAALLAVLGLWYAIEEMDLHETEVIIGQDGPFPRPPQAPMMPPTDDREIAGAVLVVLLACGALVFRRRYPLAVLWVVIGATVVTPHPRLTFFACVVAAYSAAAYSPYRAQTMASLAVAALAVSVFQDDALPTVPNKYATFLILVPIVVASLGRRTWRMRALALEREQSEAVRRAAEQERARIARELHDVVTHNVSVMVIQAGAARKVMDAAPDQAREALLAVEAGGRAAMAELRHVMGLLAPATDAPDLAPQPGLDGLDALIDRVRAAGLPVDVCVEGRSRPVPDGVALTAYRVVQEALTNTVKHAAGATSTVTLVYEPEQLRVEVLDNGGRPNGATATGNARGLVGLRERLAVYGGTLDAGPRPTGGYRVRAVIPLEPSEVETE